MNTRTLILLSLMVPTVVADANIVAEGRLVPREVVQLAFFASGQVSEILVQEGDQVQAGQVVARLGARQQIEANIASARADELAAQQGLQALYDGRAMAQAEHSQAISVANRQVRDAQYALDNYTVPSDQAGLSAMQAVVEMKEKLDQARAAFEPYKFYSSNDTNRRQLKEELDEAQSSYNAAVRRLELETTLKEAQARLDQALQDFQTLEDGPDPDQIAAGEARLAAAQAALTASQAALANLDLVATIDGTLVEMDLVVGQAVSAGQPVMTVADFSQMYVETNDLTEIEVVAVSLGQAATIRADALQEVQMHGVIEKISDIDEVKRGDVTYTVRIRLDDFDPRLRWGMTVVVTFEK